MTTTEQALSTNITKSSKPTPQQPDDGTPEGGTPDSGTSDSGTSEAQASHDDIPEGKAIVEDSLRAPLTVDLHVDCLIQQMLFGYNVQRAHKPWMRRQPLVNHSDIPRMLEGGYGLAVLGIHALPWEHPRRWGEAWRQLWKLQQIVEREERICLATTADDVEAAHDAGRLAVMPGLEGAHLLGRSLERLDEARSLGAIYLTLSHFSKNSATTPQLGLGRDNTSGLTLWGKQLIKKLESLKMLIDVAHVNEPGLLDACEAASTPVIASHTTAAGLVDSPRGISDRAVKAIAETGGVIGVMFAPLFLVEAPALPENPSLWQRFLAKFRRHDASLAAVADHICYIAELVGVAHVAIGSDFDGWIPSIPNDMRDCRDMPKLVGILRERGMHDHEINAIMGQNFLRVLRDVRG